MAGAGKPLSGGAPRRELPAVRAGRLRRQAAFVDDQADRARDPAAARALACQMRTRAADLELGVTVEDWVMHMVFAGVDADEELDRELWDSEG
jgi:hypothetical protein